MWGALKEVRSAGSDFFCTHCDRLSSFVVSPFAVFYRICGFSVGRGPFRCCGRIYSFGQRILIFVRCQYWFSSKNLRNLFCNTPWCCDVLQNIFYLCRVVACDMTYFDESVSLLSLTGNLVNFKGQGKRHIHHLYRHERCSAFCYTGVGYCLFVLGLTRASRQINERLHSWTE